MLIPEILANGIGAAKAGLKSHPQNTLLPIYRKDIYQAFLLLNQPKAKGWLGVLTAQHVLPIWQAWQEKPSEFLLSDVINTANFLMLGMVEPATATDLAGRAWETLYEFGLGRSSSNQGNAYYAGTAAVSALFDTLGRDSFEGVEISSQSTDSDLDQWASDTAKWAVWAYAGSLHNPTANLNRRFSFWSWWLDEAITQAWEMSNA